MTVGLEIPIALVIGLTLGAVLPASYALLVVLLLFVLKQGFDEWRITKRMPV